MFQKLTLLPICWLNIKVSKPLNLSTVTIEAPKFPFISDILLWFWDTSALQLSFSTVLQLGEQKKKQIPTRKIVWIRGMQLENKTNPTPAPTLNRYAMIKCHVHKSAITTQFRSQGLSGLASETPCRRNYPDRAFAHVLFYHCKTKTFHVFEGQGPHPQHAEKIWKSNNEWQRKHLSTPSSMRII